MNNAAAAAHIRTSSQPALNTKLSHISHYFSANEVHLMSAALSEAAARL